MRHHASSAKLPQVVQKVTRALTSVSASTSRRTSAASVASRWKAIRCALLGPMPGSLPSSSIRSWTGPSYTSPAYGVDWGPSPPRRAGSDRTVDDLVDHGATEQLGNERRAGQPRLLDDGRIPLVEVRLLVRRTAAGASGRRRTRGR